MTKEQSMNNDLAFYSLVVWMVIMILQLINFIPATVALLTINLTGGYIISTLEYYPPRYTYVADII